MKKIIFGWSILLVFLAHAGAQGTLQFVATLTGNSDATGSGTFSLTTNRLQYEVQTHLGYEQLQIRSPWPDPTAPVIFDLHLRFYNPPPCGTQGCYCLFRGSPTLSDDQITELEAGQWYVYAPNGPFYLQGQIVPVPEPHVLVLILLAGGIFRLFLFENHWREKLRALVWPVKGRFPQTASVSSTVHDGSTA